MIVCSRAGGVAEVVAARLPTFFDEKLISAFLGETWREFTYYAPRFSIAKN